MTSLDDPSGRTLAEQAHAAGAVDEPAGLPLIDVTLSFAARGSKDDADVIVRNLSLILLEHADVVQPLTYTFQERP